MVVVSADPRPFYNRILLSKDFLKRDELRPEEIVMKPLPFWERQGIELWSGRRVVWLDADERRVRLDTGEVLRYGRCLVATGARPLRLPVPGGDDPGLHTLRSLDDALRLREAAREATRAVVVGGGLIGVEVAAALAIRGLGVTAVEREAWLFGRVAPEAVGRAVREILEAGGVRVLTSAPVTAFEREGKGYRVGTSSLDGGAGPTLTGDLVVVGVGVAPETTFVRGATLSSDGGIVVDAGLRAVPGLWAAGDVSAWPDPLAGLRHRVEHWVHAQRQGRVAGTNMAGGDEAYAELTSYDTELFGTSVRVFGAPGLADSWQVEGFTPEGVAWGSREGRYISAYIFGNKRFKISDIKRILGGTGVR